MLNPTAINKGVRCKSVLLIACKNHEKQFTVEYKCRFIAAFMPILLCLLPSRGMEIRMSLTAAEARIRIRDVTWGCVLGHITRCDNHKTTLFWILGSRRIMMRHFIASPGNNKNYNFHIDAGRKCCQTSFAACQMLYRFYGTIKLVLPRIPFLTSRQTFYVGYFVISIK